MFPGVLVGREHDLDEILNLLRQQQCRMLTLVGLGGVGKTRLAVHAASQLSESFSNGVCLVDLQPVQSFTHLVTKVADALGVQISGHSPPEQQLLHALQDRVCLIVLDNFDHMLEHTALLSDILHHCPHTKLLVTSREALRIREEWLYPVSGLAVPSDDSDHIEAYSAIRLFVETAKRRRPSFSAADEAQALVHLCRLVEGMPLALEMAASWVESMRCSAIAEEIERDISFLSSTLRNIPEHQQSMRAVFEQSWRRLTSEQQDAFRRLSVFRGGFQQEAAGQVAQATVYTLKELVNKSLLGWEATGRYHMHALLRQYGEDKLRQAPNATGEVRSAHANYYARFLYDRLAAMNDARQLDASAEIEAELENIREAWAWMVETGDAEALRQAEQSLYLFYQFQSRYREGLAVFESAVRRLADLPSQPQRNQTLAQVLVGVGWFAIRLGRLDQARDALERSRELFRHAMIPATGMATNPLIALGVIAILQGAYRQAIDLGEQAREVSQATGDTGNLMFAHYILTGAWLARGQPQTAQAHIEQAYGLVEKQANGWFMAYCLNEMGNVARALLDYEGAKRHYQASYRLREAFQDREGMAVALSHLGEVALAQGEQRDALYLFQQSLMLYENLGDTGGLINVLHGLGQATCRLGDDDAARRYLRRALEMTGGVAIVPAVLSILTSAAELMLQTGQVGAATKVIAFVRSQCEHRDELAAQVVRLQARYQLESPSSSTDSLGIITALVLDALRAAPPVETKIGENSHLVVPLTPRELEVLQLMAQGFSNRAIANALVLALGTVKTHAHNICGKLGAANRTEAVMRARDLHLV